MTSADGTTFIISYEYVDEGDLKQFANNINPPPSVNQATANEEENDAEFLKGFFSGRDCLTGGSGWWKYELCYGKQVVQYHVSDAWHFEDRTVRWFFRTREINEQRLYWVNGIHRNISNGLIPMRDEERLEMLNNDSMMDSRDD